MKGVCNWFFKDACNVCLTSSYKQGMVNRQPGH